MVIIEEIPEVFTPNEKYLFDYWTSQLGLSPVGMRDYVERYGGNVRKIRNALKNGERFAFRAEDGVARKVINLGLMKDGFHVSVPYCPVNSGMVQKMPLDYSKSGQQIVSFEKCQLFKVSSPVKLSFHLGGFVQFSSSSGGKIVSGFCQELQRPKGVGIHSGADVDVRTGPMFGIALSGVDQYERLNSKPALVFDDSDMWSRVEFKPSSHDSLLFEFFMLDKGLSNRTSVKDGKRTLMLELPYISQICFRHELRIVEFPKLPFLIGVIVSRFPASNELEVGYDINGPGCSETSDSSRALSICARYPIPKLLEDLKLESLDYIDSGQERDE